MCVNLVQFCEVLVIHIIQQSYNISVCHMEDPSWVSPLLLRTTSREPALKLKLLVPQMGQLPCVIQQIGPKKYKCCLAKIIVWIGES